MARRQYKKSGLPEPKRLSDKKAPRDTIPRIDTSPSRNFKDADGIVIPHHNTFDAIWQSINRTYLTRSDDESKRQSYQNALAMRFDDGLMNLIRQRQRPVASLGHSIIVENDDDPIQKQIGIEINRMIESIPNFQQMKMDLLEGVWYGKAACQVRYGYVPIMGKQMLIPIESIPVNGDKIAHSFEDDSGEMKHCRTPGILVNRSFKPEGADIRMTDQGPALFLSDEYERSHFIIHYFEPYDADFFFQSEMAGSIFGNGLRSQCYWSWNLKQECMHWQFDALQTFSTNGQIIGRYPSGNIEARDTMIDIIKSLTDTSCTVMPISGEDPNEWGIDTIKAEGIGYETLQNVIDYFDRSITKMIVGQSLTSETGATGMGSGVAETHQENFDNIIRYDATNLAETLTRDLLGPIIKYNYGTLPFSVKLKLVVDKTNLKDVMIAAKTFFDMGIKMSVNDLREKAGFPAPKTDEDTVSRPATTDFRIADDAKTGDTRGHLEE